MPKIKEVYEYNNGSWENGTPIGADASNVDVALSDSTSTRDLQSVLGNVSVSDSSIKTQLSGKVDTDSGDIKDTVVSVLDPSSATDTSEDIDSTDVIVAAGEDQTTMWSKFNTFRKRVSNKFSNFLISSVEDVLEPSDTKTYSQAALNSYFADVIGYKTDADVASIGSVADQLSTLNNKTLDWQYIGDVYWWSNTWTCPANGFLNIIIIPSGASWYWYVGDTQHGGDTGWSYRFVGAENINKSFVIFCKKNSVFSTRQIRSCNTISCYYYKFI